MAGSSLWRVVRLALATPIGRGFSVLMVNFPVRDDLSCGGYLLDLSLHRRSHARHSLGYGAIMAGAFHCGGHCCNTRGAALGCAVELMLYPYTDGRGVLDTRAKKSLHIHTAQRARVEEGL
jgi:hypothetical protein